MYVCMDGWMDGWMDGYVYSKYIVILICRNTNDFASDESIE